jgi:Na+/H+-translocating membrane pyrophosphatase
MQGLSWIFFILLAATLVAAYLAIRREWLRPTMIAALTAVGSILLMMLTSLGQGNSVIQAVVVGIVVGGLAAAVTIGVAWYFHLQEHKLHDDYAEDVYVEGEQQ